MYCMHTCRKNVFVLHLIGQVSTLKSRCDAQNHAFTLAKFIGVFNIPILSHFPCLWVGIGKQFHIMLDVINIGKSPNNGLGWNCFYTLIKGTKLFLVCNRQELIIQVNQVIGLNTHDYHVIMTLVDVLMSQYQDNQSLTLQARLAKFWPTPLVVLKSSDIIVIHKVTKWAPYQD